MASEIVIADPSFKDPILISSLPVQANVYNYATGTIPANGQMTILWSVTPDRPQPSLWNYSFTVMLGTEDAAHAWPVGASLTTNQAFVEISMYNDAIGADDLINKRYNKIVMKNPSADTFPYFLYFKAYTFNTSVGVTG